MRFDEYFALAEAHRWRVTELDWSALQADVDAGLVSDFDREAVLGTAVSFDMTLLARLAADNPVAVS